MTRCATGAELWAILEGVPRGCDAEVRATVLAELRVQLHGVTCTVVDMEVLLDGIGQRLGMTVRDVAHAVGIGRLRRGNDCFDIEAG